MRYREVACYTELYVSKLSRRQNPVKFSRARTPSQVPAG